MTASPTPDAHVRHPDTSAAFVERVRDIAHVSAVQLFTPTLRQTVEFFVELMAMEVVAEHGDSVYVHSWDDYERFTVKITASDVPGLGTTWLRTTSPAALDRRIRALETIGIRGRWVDGDTGIGRSYVFDDPDGHPYALYWETDWFSETDRYDRNKPALKNQAARFPGRGANIRRLDHVNYLASDVTAAGRFLADGFAAQLTEQIVRDDGTPSAVWYHLADKTYDLVYTHDWTGSRGRLHHVAFAVDQREDILRAADCFLEAGIHIETGPHKHAIQQTFFLYVYEPGGNRIELCNAGARLVQAPDWRPITWDQAERAKGQAWGLQTIESFHVHGTPPVQDAQYRRSDR